MVLSKLSPRNIKGKAIKGKIEKGSISIAEQYNSIADHNKNRNAFIPTEQFAVYMKLQEILDILKKINDKL